MILSKRLNTCLDYTKGFKKLADIGTDHAYLPIAAVKKEYVEKALAIDNKQGPYLTASNNISKNNLSLKIKAILGDGISKIDDDVDVVVISGMGGKLISDIITNDSLKKIKRLIIQANSDSFYIREVLNDIGFFVVDEVFLNEKKKFYEIIVLERGNKKYNSLEIKYGPLNLQKKSAIFMKSIQIQYNHLNETLPFVNDKNKLKNIKEKISNLEEVISWTDKK